MKNSDLVHPSGAPYCDERPTGPIVRSAHSIDFEVHDRLADEVLKMRYLSRLRAFVAPARHR